MNKTIFIICPVTIATDEIRERLEKYTEQLENDGYKVHLPHRDTNQKQSLFDICKQNMNAILAADEVHIFYNSKSKGIHFDIGMTFVSCMMGFDEIVGFDEYMTKIKVIETEEDGEGKSFVEMLNAWVTEQT